MSYCYVIFSLQQNCFWSSEVHRGHVRLLQSGSNEKVRTLICVSFLNGQTYHFRLTFKSNYGFSFRIYLLSSVIALTSQGKQTVFFQPIRRRNQKPTAVFPALGRGRMFLPEFSLTINSRRKTVLNGRKQFSVFRLHLITFKKVDSFLTLISKNQVMCELLTEMTEVFHYCCESHTKRCS